MQSTMYALVDCNNFYVSCERVFNPKLRNRPVIVLSNNDGCAVSRSSEAKHLGIVMGEPLFKMRDLIRRHNVAVLSSNFALYGDLSARIMSIIMQAMPEVEVYSIDEAFIDLTTMQNNFNLYKKCADLVIKIERYTGVPVSIGIAPTKTLAKVANQLAKRNNAIDKVCSLESAVLRQSVLADFAVSDVWGIGRQLSKKLHAMGVHTAQELVSMSPEIIKSNFNIVMQRTIKELAGISCITLQDGNVNKQQIMVSRSFGQRVTELAVLQEALATYVSMACVKLRKQNSVAAGCHVLMHTGLHGEQSTVYQNSVYVNFSAPTFDTRLIIQYAKHALSKIFRNGYRYQKVGIILVGLSSSTELQIDIFGHSDLTHTQELMTVIDQINNKLGKSTVQFAAAGLDKNWSMQNERKSSGYTDNWLELPVVRC